MTPVPGNPDVDRGWAWVIMLAATAWNILVSGTLKTFGLVFMEFQEVFDASPTETAWMGFTFSFMMLILSPFAGYMGDRLPARWIAMVSALVGTLGIVLTGIAPTMTWAILTYGLMAGTAAAIMDSPVFGMLNVYFVKKRALANSVAFAGSGLGCLVLPVVLNYAIEHYSSRGAMFILGGLWLHGCIIAAVLRPLKQDIVIEEIAVEKEVETTHSKKKEIMAIDMTVDKIENIKTSSPTKSDINNEQLHMSEISDEAFAQRVLLEDNNGNISPTTISEPVFSAQPDKCNFVKAAFLDYWHFLKNLNMILCILAIMFGGFAYFNQLFLLPSYAHELGLSKLDGTLLVSIPGLAEICSRLLLGLVADRKFIDKTLLVISCSLVCSVLGLSVTLYPSWYVLVTYAAILGTIGGTFIPLGMPIVTMYVPANRISSATGLFLWAMGMAFALGPPVLGLVKELSGLYAYSYRVCVLFYWPACLLFLISWLRNRRATSRKPDDINCCNPLSESTEMVSIPCCSGETTNADLSRNNEDKTNCKSDPYDKSHSTVVQCEVNDDVMGSCSKMDR